MANTAALALALTALTTQVSASVGTEASAKSLILGFSAQVSSAVVAALEADNAADQGSIDAAVEAINSVTAQAAASAADLGAAITANTPPAPPAPETPPAA